MEDRDDKFYGVGHLRSLARKFHRENPEADLNVYLKGMLDAFSRAEELCDAVPSHKAIAMLQAYKELIENNEREENPYYVITKFIEE